ncbi:MAG: hypothetical protein OXD32_04610 [Endozoicomonadaceae bacterium]|nr:hypothetical protein [Endozoicomonadaceae bacterium]
MVSTDNKDIKPGNMTERIVIFYPESLQRSVLIILVCYNSSPETI